jgi:HEAT repeat protein
MRGTAQSLLRYFTIAASVLAAGSLVVVVQREPRPEGKTVRKWMWEYAKANRQGVHEPPASVMQQMGPRAIPILIKELQRQNTTMHKLALRYYYKVPNWMRRRMRDPYDVPDAYMIREAAAMTLGGLGPLAQPAIPTLQSALKDSTPHVRLRAAYALWEIDHALATEVVPILMELHTNAYNFKYSTSRYFGCIGLDAKAAVPLLRETLTDSNPNIRENAKTALQKIELAERTERNANH